MMASARYAFRPQVQSMLHGRQGGDINQHGASSAPLGQFHNARMLRRSHANWNDEDRHLAILSAMQDSGLDPETAILQQQLIMQDIQSPAPPPRGEESGGQARRRRETMVEFFMDAMAPMEVEARDSTSREPQESHHFHSNTSNCRVVVLPRWFPNGGPHHTARQLCLWEMVFRLEVFTASTMKCCFHLFRLNSFLCFCSSAFHSWSSRKVFNLVSRPIFCATRCARLVSRTSIVLAYAASDCACEAGCRVSGFGSSWAGDWNWDCNNAC